MNDSDMLAWIALYVTEINSLVCKRGQKIEMVACDSAGFKILIRRTGRTHLKAFTACVQAGMKRMPLK